jgi:hypothetical protein
MFALRDPDGNGLEIVAGRRSLPTALQSALGCSNGAMRNRRLRLAWLASFVVVAVSAGALQGSAVAVHESHHGPFVGSTSQAERLFMRVISHTRVGIRVRWRARCDSGSIREVTRFRNVAVGPRGRFSRTNGSGVAVRGKIGWDADGNPAFPEPFSFENNEAKGRLRAVVDRPGRGRCRSGPLTWEARR